MFNFINIDGFRINSPKIFANKSWYHYFAEWLKVLGGA